MNDLFLLFQEFTYIMTELSKDADQECSYREAFRLNAFKCFFSCKLRSSTHKWIQGVQQRWGGLHPPGWNQVRPYNIYIYFPYRLQIACENTSTWTHCTNFVAKYVQRTGCHDCHSRQIIFIGAKYWDFTLELSVLLWCQTLCLGTRD